MLWTTIWAVLIGLAPEWADRHETLVDRAIRLEAPAQAIWRASEHPETQAGLMAAAYAETKLAALVMEGGCRKGGCDGGKARGIWQLWPWCEASKDPSDFDGQAICARKALLGPLQRCGTWEKAFGGYAAGHGCKPWPGREKLRKQLLAKLHTYRWKLQQGELILPEEVQAYYDDRAMCSLVDQSGDPDTLVLPVW